MDGDDDLQLIPVQWRKDDDDDDDVEAEMPNQRNSISAKITRFNHFGVAMFFWTGFGLLFLWWDDS